MVGALHGGPWTSSPTSIPIPEKNLQHIKLNGLGPLSIATLAKKRPLATDFNHPHSKRSDEGSPPSKKQRAINGSGPSLHRTTSSPSKDQQRVSNSGSSIADQRRGLPIWSAKKSLIREIRENDAVVILGETGSGKTTQIPQFILEAGIAGEGIIAITQPRKVAATSLATRVATEQSTSLGDLVGYSVRFDEKSGPSTKIKYMTDGMLGRELLSDPMLQRYSVIILDEAHERTLRTDLLLTSLKDIIKQRNHKQPGASNITTNGTSSTKGKERLHEANSNPLKVIIMSATLDAERFSRFFHGAKVLYVKGRQHPVKIHHTKEQQDDYLLSALQTFFQIHTEQPPGDVLIFLPGQEDIESLTISVRTYASQIPPGQMEVLTCPMYAALSPATQAKVFVRPPPNTRKCIIATNIAETSITIPGVKYVIDTGLCKEKRYFARGKGNGVDALMTQPISRSSALQRAGRAGREGEGLCFRIYTEESFKSFREAAVPEIQRCNLTFAVLQMKCLGQNPETADFMDAPAKDTIISSLTILYALSALDQKGKVTDLGYQMSSFPLDPPQSRALIESAKYGSTHHLTSVLALLSTSGKIFYDSPERDVAAEARLKFRRPSGDHMTLLHAFRAYEEVKGTLLTNGKHVNGASTSKSSGGVNSKGLKEWCKTNFLNERSLKEAVEIRNQLRTCCERMKMLVKSSSTTPSEEAVEEGILRSLLAGLWQNTALIQPDGTYLQTIGHTPVKIHPSSTLFGKKCPAIMYDELVYTSTRYAMGVSSIPQAWLADIPLLSKQLRPG